RIDERSVLRPADAVPVGLKVVGLQVSAKSFEQGLPVHLPRPPLVAEVSDERKDAALAVGCAHFQLLCYAEPTHAVQRDEVAAVARLGKGDDAARTAHFADFRLA